MPENNKKFSTLIGKAAALKKPKLASVLLLIAALICFAIGGKLLFDRFKSTGGNGATPQVGHTVTQDTTTPSEAKVSKDDTDAYSVPADQPRSISVAAINAKGLVQRVGLTKENRIAVPSNIYFAGWYTNSAKPGEAGLSIIDGHVSGRYADGVFKQLTNVQERDIVSVEYGDRSVKTFEVVETKTMPEARAAEYLFAKRSDIKQQLNLVTCGGKFNKDTQTFADRVVVVAKLVE